MSRSQPPPALVFGSGLTVLGVIRSLARAGIPSLVVPDARDFAARSRWYREAPAPAGGRGAQDDLEGYLSGLPMEQAVLMPCSDAWVMRCARLPEASRTRYRACVAAPAAIEALVDKASFATAAREAGVPVPRTAVIRGPDDLAALPGERLAGAFLKPRRSQEFFRRFGVKAFRIRDGADARRRLGEIAPTGLEVLLQEYVPGPAHHHVFVDGFAAAGGRVEAVLGRRRLRMYPPDFGNSTYMVSVAPEELAGAVDGVTRLLEHLRYRGIFSAELKYDERDRLFKLLEVNARPWWYVEFATRCGVNVCAMAYRNALGLAYESPAPYEVGRHLVYPYYDFGACRTLRRSGALSLWEWARSWLTAQRPVFRWSDPLPATVDTIQGTVRMLRRVVAHGG